MQGIQLFFVTFLCLLLCVSGSWGDIDPVYQKCLSTCGAERCKKDEKQTEMKKQSAYTSYAIQYSPPYQQLVSLTCTDLCQYGCIEEISVNRSNRGHPTVKYYGHWPFIRYFGLEEPASVLFSILNMIPHFCHLIWSFVSKQKTCYMKRWLQGYALVACIAWISSAIYHSKKNEQTTHLDLITALAFIVSGLLLAARRIIGISVHPKRFAVFTSSLLLCWGWRANSMLQGEVSFDSHMWLSIGLVVLTTLLWVGWVLHTLLFVSNRREGRAKYLCLLCQGWLCVASALELFDFPPIYGICDAHALWHAATVPLGFLWYRFWALDCEIRHPAEINEEMCGNDSEKEKVKEKNQ